LGRSDCFSLSTTKKHLFALPKTTAFVFLKILLFFGFSFFLARGGRSRFGWRGGGQREWEERERVGVLFFGCGRGEKRKQKKNAPSFFETNDLCLSL
jgi:hypothetical protein